MSILEGRLPGSSCLTRIEYGNLITAVDELIEPRESCDLVCAGFVDLQVNGFAGVDYNDPAAPHEAIAASIRRMFETGVTRFLPTVITGSEERIIGALRNLAAFRKRGGAEAEAIAGFHVEGPHISPEDGPRGAHPREHVRPPNTEEFERWQEAADGGVKLTTLSPEWSEAPTYARHVTRSGVVVSIGHTRANSEQIAAILDAGASTSTHLGNGSYPVLPKTDNYIWDQLVEDRLTAAFIVDGIHIPGAFFRASLRAKGIERSLLVTDAVMPAMCEPGLYRLGAVDVELHANGSVTLQGGSRLAGSALRMDHAVGNAVRWGGITLREAISMATVNPARTARLAGRLRGLNPGEKTDLVRFAWDEASRTLTVLETIIAGETVYSNPVSQGA